MIIKYPLCKLLNNYVYITCSAPIPTFQEASWFTILVQIVQKNRDAANQEEVIIDLRQNPGVIKTSIRDERGCLLHVNYLGV